jgi:hypothetical protein
MKRPLIYCALAGALALVFSSCSHVYYAPNGQNVPLFKEKGEIQVSAGSAGSGEGGGANVMAAYAPGQHVGVILNSYIASGSNDDNGADGRGYVLEGGAGYFTPINDFLVFEAYAGLGGGNIRNNYADNSSSDVKFIRPYIQPAIGVSTDYVDFAIASRFAMANYTGINRNGTITDSTNIAQLSYLDNHSTVMFWEPGVTIRGGWKYVKVQFQYVWSVPFTDTQMNRDNHNASLGLFFTLAPRYRN